jgi:hypothetical protein
MTVVASTVYKMGKTHASAEISLGVVEAQNDIMTEESDIRSLVFNVTGKKYDSVDLDDINEIVNMYQDGYYDGWEEFNDTQPND